MCEMLTAEDYSCKCQMAFTEAAGKASIEAGLQAAFAREYCCCDDPGPTTLSLQGLCVLLVLQDKHKYMSLQNLALEDGSLHCRADSVLKFWSLLFLTFLICQL